MILRKFVMFLSLYIAALLPAVSFPYTNPDYRITSWITTTADKPWAENSGSAPVKIEGKGGQDIEILVTESFQTIDGFGGAFNEKGWAALSVLDEDQRRNVLKEIFDPERGLKFNLCRVPIGASDYAMDRYTLDETINDFEMRDFSIERDKKMLIPYIKAAMKYRPDLKLWGSAWTPPTWMKDFRAFDGFDMRSQPEIYSAYALYLARFIEAYRAEGLNITAVCQQNEPLVMAHYPSCLWLPGQFLDFIKNYMGPIFLKRGLTNAIWLGTLQDGNYNAFPGTVLNDPDANRYISAVGLQWDGINSVSKIRANFPDKKIVQTETECGNLYWKAGFNPDKPQNDWDYGSYTWGKIRSFISLGANSYMLWNMVLDREGKNIDSVKPWPQNAAVVVNTSDRSVTYTPMFYAMKHFSFFIPPGSKLMGINVMSNAWNDAIAFEAPDGSLILEIMNDSEGAKPLAVKIGNSIFKVLIPDKSYNTLAIKQPD